MEQIINLITEYAGVIIGAGLPLAMFGWRVFKRDPKGLISFLAKVANIGILIGKAIVAISEGIKKALEGLDIGFNKALDKVGVANKQ
jgi:hypothetical protein